MFYLPYLGTEVTSSCDPVRYLLPKEGGGWIGATCRGVGGRACVHKVYHIEQTTRHVIMPKLLYAEPLTAKLTAQQKYERRRRLNNIAVRKCRDKIMGQHKNHQTTIDTLSRENEVLRNYIKKLRHETGLLDVSLASCSNTHEEIDCNFDFDFGLDAGGDDMGSLFTYLHPSIILE